MTRQAVVDALVADGWELVRESPRMVLERDGRVVVIRRGGAVVVGNIELRPSVPDEDVVRYVAALCAPDLFGGAA